MRMLPPQCYGYLATMLVGGWLATAIVDPIDREIEFQNFIFTGQMSPERNELFLRSMTLFVQLYPANQRLL